MNLLARRRLMLAAVLLYLTGVALSVWILELRRVSLQFHTRDYNYFIEQAARLADPGLRDRFALNVDGYNFLGMKGSEGATDIFQAIHTEYFRYTYTLLLWLFDSTWALYIFFSALFFLPVLYAAFLYRPTPAGEGSGSAFNQPKNHMSLAPAVLLVLLYVLYPATFPSATSDLRSRFLFSSAWTLLGLAVFYDRPFREKLLFFLFLLSIREEGIVLGGVMIVINFFRTRRASRWRQTAVLTGLAAAAFALFLLFMRRNGYLQGLPTALPVPIPSDWLIFLYSKRGLASLALAGLALGGLLWLAYRRWPGQVSAGITGVTYGAAVLMPAPQTIHEGAKWFARQGGVTPGALLRVGEYLVDPFGALTVYMLLLLFVLLLEVLPGRARRVWAGALAGLCAVFLAMTLQTLPAAVRGYRQNVAPAALVWEFKGTLDPYQDSVLVDYQTLQAFYDVSDVFVYQRLPLWLVHQNERYFPANQQVLAGLLRDRLEYAVIGADSLDEVQAAAALAGVPARVIESNERYLVLQFK